MNDLRARGVDLCMAESMSFQQHHEYRTTHPIKDVLHDQFFTPVRGQMYAGDTITICRFDKEGAQRRDAKLLEVATVRVISSGHSEQAVPLLLVGEIIAVAPPVVETKGKKAA